jgi:hypothetical protein
MKTSPLQELLQNKTVVTEDEKNILMKFFKKTNSIDEYDLRRIEKDSLLFIIQERASGDDRANKLWEKLSSSIQNCDSRILDSTKIFIILGHSSEHPCLLTEHRLIYGNFSAMLNSGIVSSKLAWIIDDNFNDELEITFVLASPKTHAAAH